MARNARAYWQTLFHPKDGTESDMLIRLILAPFDNVHSSDPENLPSYSATYAQPVLTPKMFMNAIALLDVGYLTKDLNFPESVMLEAFAAQYAILGLDHFEEGHLKRGGFREMVIRFIKVDPEHCFRVFNGLLGEGDVLLLDCRTEEPFVFKKIPRACFPEKPDQDVARLWHEKSKEAQERACEIFESYHDRFVLLSYVLFAE